MPYPVLLVIEPSSHPRNRLTVFFRVLLAIPHAILVGPIYWSLRTGAVGLLGAAAVDVAPTAGPRDKGTIAARLLLVIPHLIVLPFLLFAWLVTTVIAWFAILFTEAYPPSLYSFGVGVMRWALRVETYMLLLVDDYPPFDLS